MGVHRFFGELIGVLQRINWFSGELLGATHLGALLLITQEMMIGAPDFSIDVGAARSTWSDWELETRSSGCTIVYFYDKNICTFVDTNIMGVQYQLAILAGAWPRSGGVIVLPAGLLMAAFPPSIASEIGPSSDSWAMVTLCQAMRAPWASTCLFEKMGNACILGSM